MRTYLRYGHITIAFSVLCCCLAQPIYAAGGVAGIVEEKHADSVTVKGTVYRVTESTESKTELTFDKVQVGDTLSLWFSDDKTIIWFRRVSTNSENLEKRKVTPIRITNSIGISMNLIPDGTFKMRVSRTPKEWLFSMPHQVTLTQPFYLGRYEVTNAQWKRVMGNVPSKWKDDDRPVEQVSWEDAVEFCRKLSELPEEKAADRVYRLPTEAEWEWACRAGTTTNYSFGDDVSRLGEYAWFLGNSGGETHPVGQKKPNPWGLYDMHGNVDELCSDWGSRKALITDPPAKDPRGPSDPGDLWRIARGGCWKNQDIHCWSGNLGSAIVSQGSDWTGFRLALSPSGK